MKQIRYFCLGLAVVASSCEAWSSFQPPKNCDGTQTRRQQLEPLAVSRRMLFSSALVIGVASVGLVSRPSFADASSSPSEEQLQQQQAVEVVATGDARKLFNEGRALESQGNMAAAQRLYSKVTKIAPRFVYGWSNLGNTQTAFGDLDAAEESYTTAVELCNESLRTTEEGFGKPRCSDLYILLLNRGSLRLNNGREKDALADLQQAASLRGRPDALVLQNLARAKELNGMYAQADRDYTTAISMTANEVNPFWLRSASEYQFL